MTTIFGRSPRIARPLRAAVVVVALAAALIGIQIQQALPAAAAGRCHASYVMTVKPSSGSDPVMIPGYVDEATGSNPGGNHSISCALWNGMSEPPFPNAGTLQLQRTLNRCYNENLATDGYFGYYTEQALKRAQSDEGIEDDGLYGIESARYLKHDRMNAAGCSKIKRPWGFVSPNFVRILN